MFLMKNFKIVFLIFTLFSSLIVFRCLYAQEVICDNSGISEAFRLAVNTVDINVRRGILAAGGDYGGEWTRDCAINSWNGVSLLRPEVAENSLWSVTKNKDSIGHQYWDKIIWVIAALNHYKVTGNRDFLAKAYKCSANTMNRLEQYTFDSKYGLFMGPSVISDGIAGYPVPIYDSLNKSSFVLDHKNSKYIKCLSTNCVYYGAYLSMIEMCSILHVNKVIPQIYQKKSENLKANILKYFYNAEENKFYYLIDFNGKLDKSQDALGTSFAVMFGIIDKEKANLLTQNSVTSRYGITSVYPDFARYSKEKPGRHNNIVWPMINGFYAKACVYAGNYKSFTFELNNLTHLALDADKGNYNFREIYNPYTGVPDGGWQCDTHWESCREQTWSATAYINMVLYGLAGIRFENNTITFSPYLTPDIHSLELRDIKYRNSILTIKIKGSGNKIKSFTINNKNQTEYTFNAANTGNNEISIELEK